MTQGSTVTRRNGADRRRRLHCAAALVAVAAAVLAAAAPVVARAATVVVPSSKPPAAAPTVAVKSTTTTTAGKTSTATKTVVSIRRTSAKTTTRSATTKRRTTTTRGATRSATTIEVAATLAVVDATSTTRPAIVATFPPTTVTAPPAPTTTLTPNTTLAPSTAGPSSGTSADFDIVVPNPGISLTAGATAVFLVIVAPRTTVSPLVTFLVLGLPDGAIATMSPNPTAGATELRVATSATMIPATYNLRLVGTAGSITRTAPIAMAVTGPASTTTIASGAPTPSGAFALSVVGDGKRLRSGGAVSFEVTIVPGTSFPGPVSLNVSGVPGLVSSAFTVTPTSSKSTLWLSTTLNPVPGTYSLLLVATSGTTVQSVPLTLVIE